MASGEIVAILSSPLQPGTDMATPRAVVGGSTPPEKIPTYAFDPATPESIDFDGILLDNYDGGGVEVRYMYGTSSTVGGNFRWRAAFRAVPDDAEDLSDAHSYQYQFRTTPGIPAVGIVRYAKDIPGVMPPGIRFTHGAQMDNLAAGEKFILRFGRHATEGDDTSTADALLYPDSILITER